MGFANLFIPPEPSRTAGGRAAGSSALGDGGRQPFHTLGAFPVLRAAELRGRVAGSIGLAEFLHLPAA
jgi:hypothetical protein